MDMLDESDAEPCARLRHGRPTRAQGPPSSSLRRTVRYIEYWSWKMGSVVSGKRIAWFDYPKSNSVLVCDPSGLRRASGPSNLISDFNKLECESSLTIRRS